MLRPDPTPLTLVVCPVCAGAALHQLFEQGGRRFIECHHCDLLFADPPNLLSTREEHERYKLHNNGDDAGYIQHLNRLTAQLQPHIRPAMTGLDYGSGPNPVLSRLLSDLGLICTNYDPFFGPPLPPLPSQFDVITCSEAAEHFTDPRNEFTRMDQLLRTDGVVAVMTSLRTSDRRTSSWWYLRDKTHRCFYSSVTFEFLATILSWRLVSIADDVAIFKKGAGPPAEIRL